MNEHGLWMLTYEAIARQSIDPWVLIYDLKPYMQHDYDWVDRLYIDTETQGGW